MRSRRPLSLAVIGVGPRGLSVLERLVVRLAAAPRPVTIWAVEPVEPGPGRVWRTRQSGWYATNATAGELTAHSPDSPFPGRDFAAWSAVAPHEYPSRRHYGAYLRETFHRLCAEAPDGVEIRPVTTQVTGLTRTASGLRLRLPDRTILADKVVLTTGHSDLEPSEEDRRLRASGRVLGPGIAADLPLDDILAGETVAVRGLGLTFYDVVRSLTLGRGGRFTRADGKLRYVPSGDEPLIVAGSRSGLPFLARAQVHRPDLAPDPVLLTTARLDRLRTAALDARGSTKLDFAAEVEPLIWAEVEHAYYRRIVGLRDGEDEATRFTTAFPDVVDERDRVDERRTGKVLAAFGLTDVPPLRPEELARPFDGLSFADPAEFRARLREVLVRDVAESRRGPEGSPVKAALEMLRTLRPALPGIVDFGGLLPSSHRDFLSRFVPANFLLSAGPPPDHVEQLVALLDAGVLDVVGPDARIDAGFTISSPRVAGSRRNAGTLIDARAPGPDLARDRNPLLRQMLADGLISEFVNTDPATGESFATGGLSVTPAPFRVVDARGEPAPDIHALGVITQNTRWFTQVGTGRPGQDSPFCRDADAIAAAMLGAA
ncbi:FAD/NAD(P)-binding protein [Amycolatopsis sp. NPDC006125]|uniref:FAD/NAD(P)-binding protein n=1 Tax=Amycolatopsis sp. NPDC006125 TaxID=3156730 RepID=UPI0033A2DEAF